jgi:hypothetical protein
MAVGHWQNNREMLAKKFTCGHCGLIIAADKGYSKIDSANTGIYLCPFCEQPTYFQGDKQVPGVAFGNDVSHLPTEVADAYREARNCMAVSAYTASVLLSRKLLMNIAVSQGDKAGRTFADYIQYLTDHGYVPPNGKHWVDHIRKKGNEATHEIHVMGRPDAEDLIVFIEMILKFTFEFPSRVPKR